MKTGYAISGAGHAAAMALVVLGVPWFSPRERPPVPVTEVSFVSEAEFDRAQAASRAPRDEAAPTEEAAVASRAEPEPEPVEPEPEPEAVEPEPEPEAVEPEPEPVEPAPEVVEPAPVTDQQVATLAPAFDPETPLVVPPGSSLVAPNLTIPGRLAAVSPPRARPEVSTAPVPVVAADPVEISETPVAPEVPEAAVPDPVRVAPPLPRKGNIAPVVVFATPETVLEKLKTEIAREQIRAQERTIASPPRPEPPAEPVATAPTEPTTTEPAPPSEGRAAATSLAEGPPITNAEKDGLRLAVQRCWVVPAGVRDAAELRVVLSAELDPDGAVITGSIRAVEPDPLPDARFRAAYDAGRRALIRCSPYSDLPREKYGRWRNIEVVFNPRGMVSW